MFEKLKGVEERFLEIEKHLSDPEIVKDRQAYQKLIREHAELNKIVSAFNEYQKILQGIEDSTELLQDSDPEIKNLAREELNDLNQNKDRLEDDLRKLLLPKDPNDDKNVIVEIRAGTGGDEAALFAADLFRMYSRFFEGQRWKVEIMSEHATGVGGFKEIIAMVQGQGAYSRMKYESGTHRVQRVPTTETQGRIHTSAVTVAVLPLTDTRMGALVAADAVCNLFYSGKGQFKAEYNSAQKMLVDGRIRAKPGACARPVADSDRAISLV